MSAEQKKQAIKNLHIIFIKNIFFSGILGFVISYLFFWVLSTKEDIKNNWAWSIIIGIIIAIVAFYFKKDLENKIAKEIDAIGEGRYTQKYVDDLIKDFKKKIKILEESNESEIRNKQSVFNLVRLNQSDASRREDMIRHDPFLQKYQYSEEDFMYQAEKKYTDAESMKKLCAVIKTINKDSWNQLATHAALDALNLQEVDVHKLDSDPEQLLRLDIYVYLRAWLVNSIDNIVMGMKPMPVNYIKLRYLISESEQSPEPIGKYENAFLFLIQRFDMGTFGELIEQDFSSEQIEICKGVSPHLITLIEMLKDFSDR